MILQSYSVFYAHCVAGGKALVHFSKSNPGCEEDDCSCEIPQTWQHQTCLQRLQVHPFSRIKSVTGPDFVTSNFDCDSRGGRFKCFGDTNPPSPFIIVNVPVGSLPRKTPFNVKQIMNRSYFPSNTLSSDLGLTNVVNLSPHKQLFNRPLTCTLYYTTVVRDTENIYLLYNDSDNPDDPDWRYLTKEYGSHGDPIFEAFLDRVVIKFQHFCEVFVIKTENNVRFAAEVFQVGLLASYNPKHKLLEVTAEFMEPCAMKKVNFNHLHY